MIPNVSGSVEDTIVPTSVRKGLVFLSEKQTPSGGFHCMTAWSFNCVNDDMQDFFVEGGKAYVEPDHHSVYPSILIGLSLLPAKGMDRADAILDGIAHFLVENRYRFGLWQHFTRDHHWHPVNPCDMDDTSLASMFLNSMHIPTPKNRGTLLSNMTNDGRFYTWFALRWTYNKNPIYWYHALRELRSRSKSANFWSKTECEPDDVDAVVNANVLSYVGLDQKTTKVVEWINRILSEQTEQDCDKWYHNLTTIHYFFSRIYCPHDARLEKTRKLIRERVLGRLSPTGIMENHPMDTALAVSTLLNVDCAEDIPQASIDYLTESQRSDGSWPRKVVYYGGPRKVVGWGSEELTTAFCIEAISRFSKPVKGGR